MKIYYDCEANGLLDDTEGHKAADTVWCVSFELETGATWDFVLDGHEESGQLPVSKLKETLPRIIENGQADGTKANFVCHNQYGYDLYLLNKLLDIRFSSGWLISPDHSASFIDTLDLSQSLYPDRPLPKGCPNMVFNPVTEKNRRVGSHGLEAWGFRVANAKPTVHDWLNGEPQFYLHRCKEDVKITKLTYLALMREMEDNRL